MQWSRHWNQASALHGILLMPILSSLATLFILVNKEDLQLTSSLRILHCLPVAEPQWNRLVHCTSVAHKWFSDECWSSVFLNQVCQFIWIKNRKMAQLNEFIQEGAVLIFHRLRTESSMPSLFRFLNNFHHLEGGWLMDTSWPWVSMFPVRELSSCIWGLLVLLAMSLAIDTLSTECTQCLGQMHYGTMMVNMVNIFSFFKLLLHV